MRSISSNLSLWTNVQNIKRVNRYIEAWDRSVQVWEHQQLDDRYGISIGGNGNCNNCVDRGHVQQYCKGFKFPTENLGIGHT